MKLFTEEQMHSVILLALGRHGIYIPNKHYQDLIDLITPIEIPSDEEIQKESKFKSNHSNPQAVQFNPALNIVWVEGAIWMRNKIQGGNK
jgi:hypothetical protein